MSFEQFMVDTASITSPRPSMRLLRMNCSISSAVRVAPEFSKGVAGTQEGIMKSTLSGRSSDSLYMARTPATPQTLAISWGSAIMVVVPWGIITREKESGMTILLSMCTWASMKPGQRYAPPASISSLAAEPLPTPMMVSSERATSPSSISFVNTLTTLAFFTTSVASPLRAAVISSDCFIGFLHS